MVRNLFLISLLGLLASCASVVPPGGLKSTGCNPNLNLQCVEEPQVVEMPTHKELRSLPSPEKPVVVAVYQYTDNDGTGSGGKEPQWVPDFTTNFDSV